MIETALKITAEQVGAGISKLILTALTVGVAYKMGYKRGYNDGAWDATTFNDDDTFEDA